jgi:hypothetical protein
MFIIIDVGASDCNGTRVIIHIIDDLANLAFGNRT